MSAPRRRIDQPSAGSKQPRPRLAVTRHAYTLQDVADAIEQSYSVVARLVDKGILETYPVGRSVRVSQAQLDRCMERLERGEAKDLKDEG